jgi:hypothetical protein
LVGGGGVEARDVIDSAVKFKQIVRSDTSASSPDSVDRPPSVSEPMRIVTRHIAPPYWMKSFPRRKRYTSAAIGGI